MSTIIISDIHGCRRALSRLLEKLDPSPRRDRLILLGDLFDRGPESWEVLQMVQSLEAVYRDSFTLLRGNHEDYLLADKLSLSQKWMWDRVGRQATVKSFRSHEARMEDATPWLQKHCRLFYRDEEIQCVHAGLKVEPLETNDNQTLIHDHSVVLENRYAGRLTVVGHIALSVPTWFTGDGKTTEKLPWGREMPLPEKGIICIDTGCGKGGRLTAMVLDGKSFRLESAAEK